MGLSELSSLLALLRDKGVLVYRTPELELQLDPAIRPALVSVEKPEKGQGGPALKDVYENPDLYDGESVLDFAESKAMI